MKWETTIPPVTLPVDYATAKLFLRLDTDDEQPVVDALISAATEYAERHLQRSIVPRTMRATYYPTECGNWHPPLPMGPVISVVSVTDQHGDTIDPSAYQLRREGTGDYLHVTRGGYPVTITYTAGYPTTPAAVKTGILMHTVSLFETRGATSATKQYATPYGLDALYDQLKIGGGIG